MAPLWAKAIVKEETPAMKVGTRLRHCSDNRLVEIVEVEIIPGDETPMWWRWREVLPGNRLGNLESGYGWG